MFSLLKPMKLLTGCIVRNLCSPVNFISLYSLPSLSEKVTMNLFETTKQHRLIIFQFCGSDVHHESHWVRSKMSTGLRSFLEPYEGSLFPCFFQLLKAVAVVFWLLAFFFHLENRNLNVSLILLQSLLLFL